MAQDHCPVHAILEGIRTAGIVIRIRKRGAIEVPYGGAESALVSDGDRASGGSSRVLNDRLRRRNGALDGDGDFVRGQRSSTEPGETDATHHRETSCCT